MGSDPIDNSDLSPLPPLPQSEGVEMNSIHAVIFREIMLTTAIILITVRTIYASELPNRVPL